MIKFMDWPKHPNAEHRRSIQDEGFVYWASRNKSMAVCLVALVVIILVKDIL